MTPGWDCIYFMLLGTRWAGTYACKVYGADARTLGHRDEGGAGGDRSTTFNFHSTVQS